MRTRTSVRQNASVVPFGEPADQPTGIEVALQNIHDWAERITAGKTPFPDFCTQSEWEAAGPGVPEGARAGLVDLLLKNQVALEEWCDASNCVPDPASLTDALAAGFAANPQQAELSYRHARFASGKEMVSLAKAFAARRDCAGMSGVYRAYHQAAEKGRFVSEDSWRDVSAAVHHAAATFTMSPRTTDRQNEAALRCNQLVLDIVALLAA